MQVKNQFRYSNKSQQVTKLKQAKYLKASNRRSNKRSVTHNLIAALIKYNKL